jgi:GT2 family glycosyltransferase/glycosyltransferase involved in cell wall biosynthesis
MSLSKSSALEPAGWPVVPQTTSRESSHRTDSDEFRDSPRGRIICVLGMHRSGTSVATRLMNLLGVYLGAEEHLMGPHPDNPKGYWEYQPILDLNEEILGRLGGNWHEPPISPPGWETTAEFADLRQRARDLVARTFTSDDWGWKDPRTCLTLPFWRQILPPVHYVICMRSPAEVAPSLEKRDGFTVEKSIRLWQVYTQAALEQTAGLPRHFIFYEDLIHAPHEEASRLARFLGRQDALDQPAIPAAIEDFIDPDFHRHRTSLINTLDNPNVLFPAKAFYFAVRIAARSGGSCLGLSDMPGRDPVGEQVWTIFSRSSRRAQEDRDEMTRDRAGLESRLGEISAEAQGLRVRLSDLEKQAADREVAHSAIQDRSRELEADNRRLAEERDRASTLASELRSALEEHEAACQEQAKVIAGRDAEIAERAALVQQLEIDREAGQAEMKSIQARSGELEADNRRLGEERDRAEALASELRAALADREAACQEQARVIVRRDAEVAALTERAALVDRLEEEREARRAEMVALRGRLDAIASDNRRLGEERDRAEALARELRAGLDGRDTVVASLGSRLADLLAAREGASDWIRDVNEMGSRLEARIAELTGQIGGLAAEFAQMGSREGGREAAMLQIRDRLSARQDEIQAMVSRVSGTVDYLGMVRRVRADIRRLLPPAALVMVISKGDPDLLDVEGHDAWHFPQDDRGHYAGHYPAESGDAIAHMEALRARGGRFLVIPSSASWWLEHYAGLAHHLDTNYQRIWKNADCQIYELARPDRSHRREPEAPETTDACPTVQAHDIASPIAAPALALAATVSAMEATPGPAPETLSKYGLYVKLIGELRELVPSILPRRSTLMVISRGDEELLKIDGVTAWHFPQTQAGVYAGHHPADDQAAVSHLRSLIRRGGQYLLIPNTAFWWLDYYKEFGRHLEDHSECLWRDDRCIIYRFLDAPGVANDPTGSAPEERLTPGETEVAIRCPETFRPPTPIDRYDAWLQANEWSLRRASLLRKSLSRVTARPLLSLIMPVYDPPIEYLNRAIQSIHAQIYENWELCIADDASTDPEVVRLLDEWEGRDSRIKVTRRRQNGNISRATNTAAEMAEGEFLVFMDNDDEIEPDALGEVVLALAERPDADILYTDDDKIDASGRRFAPQFKPDWSPELLLSYMYLSHLLVMRRTLYWRAGGMRLGFEGSQDYDLALRATEIAGPIVHIPRILYHWRVVPGSTASSGSAKRNSFQAGLRAVQEALDRRRIDGEVIHPEWAAQAGCGIFSHRFPDRGPRVTLLIPTRNHWQVLKTCVDSLARTAYENYEVVIIDNMSDDPDALAYLESLPLRVLRIPNPGDSFNYAAINNSAARQVTSALLLFLNDDTEVIEASWLSQMVGYLGMPGVGAVGARLLFPDGRIQHAGVIHGLYHGKAGPAFKLSPCWDNGYLSYARVARNYSAVTAACMLTRRDHFLSLGGFDEEAFPVAYNDVDYGYRMIDAGHRIVYCPSAELLHHEGHSRGSLDNPEELASFLGKYRGRRDPYYNVNLSLDDERFSIEARTVAPTGLGPIPTLMLAFNLNWEGAPYSQFEMTARLKEMGIIEPVVYCPHDGPLRKEYERIGVRVDLFPHPVSGAFTIAAYEEAIRAFSRYIRENGVELVYGNTLQTFYGIDAAREAGLPSIWNPRESEPWQTYFDHFVPEIAARALACFRYPYKVVFVADATRERFSALNTHHNFTTVRNGLDRDRFEATLARWPREAARRHLDLGEDSLAVLILGTVCDRKGQLDLIEALGHLDEGSALRVTGIIVGDRPGPYSERLHAARRSLGEPMRSRIRIIPETSDVAPYYSAADLFVCSSRIESFPRVILEAMAVGLPIITTPVFGIREQVQENINALFYPPGDSHALADAIRRLLRDPGLRSRMARSSPIVLGALDDYETMASSYGRIFLEAWLNGRPRSCVESSE